MNAPRSWTRKGRHQGWNIAPRGERGTRLGDNARLTAGVRSVSIAGLVFGVLLSTVCGRTLAAPRQHDSFDDGWRFHLGEVSGAESVAFQDDSWRQLSVPHDWSVEAGFSQTNASCTGYLPGGIGWYRKTFATLPAWDGKRVLVTFDGVYRNADVWINGHHLGERPYGYITFQHDLTPHLTKGGSNVLAVRVERENVADSRWYPGSGIYRHVWLTAVSPVHVPLWGDYIYTARATPDSADVVIHTEVTNTTATAEQVRVTWQIAAPGGGLLQEYSQVEQLAGGTSHTFSQWQKVAAPQLWSPDTPKLYRMRTRVFVSDELQDETQTTLGIRTCYFDANNGFFLNGRNLKLKGLCLHHDGGVVGAAVPEDVLARRLRLVKEIGGNAIRCSHNPMAPELYRLCDELGLLVMDEAFDEWEIGKRKWVEGRNVGSARRFGYSEDFEQWAEQDSADMVRRDRNHPSIIMWSIGNEIDYPTDPYVLEETRTVEGFARDDRQPRQTRLAVVAPRLIAAVKRQDATRPVTMALANMVSSDATGLAQMLDVVGYNYQEADYVKDHRAFPTRVIYGSENGMGYREWRTVLDNSFIPAQFLWVGFDFLGEANQWPNHGSQAGLFDTRGFKKPNASYRQALWSEVPMVALTAQMPSGESGARRGRGRMVPQWGGPGAGSTLRVVVYSNCEEVQLRLNGRALETQPVGDARTLTFQVAYEPGELVALGLRGGAAVATNRIVTAGEPAALHAEVDRPSLVADGSSVAHVVISVLDEKGNLVFAARNDVSVEVEGAGRLLGVDNGDQNDTTALQAHTKRTNGGQLLVLLQAGRASGELRLQASAGGLAPVRLTLPVRP